MFKGCYSLLPLLQAPELYVGQGQQYDRHDAQGHQWLPAVPHRGIRDSLSVQVRVTSDAEINKCEICRFVSLLVVLSPLERACQYNSGARKKERKKCFYLTMHSTHFIYGYMASDIW